MAFSDISLSITSYRGDFFLKAPIRLCTLVLCLFQGPLLFAQAPSLDTLNIVNWNIQYFGDASHHSNVSLQVNGVRNMMNAMNADIYAFCEVVNIDSFASVINSLPGDYGYLVAGFGSFANSPSSSGYASAQKLAIAYRKDRVRNLAGRAFMSSSSSAYSNFSSGRFPFLVTAEVLGKDQAWHSLHFLILHAKAYSDATSCQRRIDGCAELKDSLDHYYSQKPFLLLGDYNDDLDTSICAGATESNYALLLHDSLNYKPETLDISMAGAFSIDGYTSLIDHVIASPAMYSYYLPGSAKSLRNLSKQVDPAYDSHISDHFPVLTRYMLDHALPNAVSSPVFPNISLYPNPVNGSLYVSGINWERALVMDLNGNRIKSVSILSGPQIDLDFLKAGTYFIQFFNHESNSWVRPIIKQP